MIFLFSPRLSNHVMPFVFLSLTEKTRTFPKLFGFFGLVRLETVYRDTNSHVMPTLACALASVFFCPFLLKEKDQKFKADIKGLTH